MKKLIINLSPTGMVPTREMTPYVPITSKEIIKTALACARLGASIIHIHARDASGSPTWKKEVFAKIIYGIREKNSDLILCVTTSGRNWTEFEKRSDCLDLKGDVKPDMASLTVGSMNFIKQESVNSPSMIERLALKMRQRGIKLEIEVFEPGMVHKANYLITKGVVSKKAPYFNILLGSLGTSPLEPTVLSSFLHLLPHGAVWALAGIGTYQLDANVLAMSLGGNVRVGLEDTIYFDRDKKRLASNVMLVKRIVALAKTMQIEIATPKEVRATLGLKQHHA